MKPNFIWVGTGKSGSTLAFRVLGRHPDIYLGKLKEHNYFLKKNYSEGEGYYKNQLADYKGERYFGDISPAYYRNFGNIDRILEFYRGQTFPKIIFSLRNPISFYVSRYYQILKVGNYFEKYFAGKQDLIGDMNSEYFNSETSSIFTDLGVLESLKYVVENLAQR